MIILFIFCLFIIIGIILFILGLFNKPKDWLDTNWLCIIGAVLIGFFGILLITTSTIFIIPSKDVKVYTYYINEKDN